MPASKPDYVARSPTVLPPVHLDAKDGLDPDRPRSHQDAVERLNDGPFVGYVLIQMFRLGEELFIRRWPILDSQRRRERQQR